MTIRAESFIKINTHNALNMISSSFFGVVSNQIKGQVEVILIRSTRNGCVEGNDKNFKVQVHNMTVYVGLCVLCRRPLRMKLSYDEWRRLKKYENVGNGGPNN